MTGPDRNKDRVEYLLGLIGKSRLHDDFVDIDDISDVLHTMLTPVPIADPYVSASTESQQATETRIRLIYESKLENKHVVNNPFVPEQHRLYIIRLLSEPMDDMYEAYDANHAWMLYWLLNAHSVVQPSKPMPELIVRLASEKLNGLLVEDGKHGVGGGAHQNPHLATSYACVTALVAIGDHETLARIRYPMAEWLQSTKQPDGLFRMTENGECDVRAMYCALVIASLLDVVTPELTSGALKWLNKCQTFEGGFAPTPGAEAHGGYTFCAVASYFILLRGQNISALKEHIDVDNLIRWTAMRQLQVEGGFNGRSNKLVDACYSFWIGAVLAMLETITESELFNRDALKAYIFNCSQNPRGGFVDKPGAHVDYYHTNYTLLGLSIGEHTFTMGETIDPFNINATPVDPDLHHTAAINPVFGTSINQLASWRK